MLTINSKRDIHEASKRFLVNLFQILWLVLCRNLIKFQKIIIETGVAIDSIHKQNKRLNKSMLIRSFALFIFFVSIYFCIVFRFVLAF